MRTILKMIPVLALALVGLPGTVLAGLQQDWANRKQTIELPTGVTLRYVETGPPAGEPLILLHGLTDSSRSWSMTLTILEPKYHVFIPDQRGHGASEAPGCCYAMADFAGDLVAFMDAKGIAKATLAGHSMGGFIAQYVAIAHPERVKRLVLVASAAAGVGNDVLEWVRAQARTFTSLPIDPNFIDQWTSNPSPVDPTFLKYVKSETSYVPIRTWREATLGLLGQDFQSVLPEVKVPTLILWGSADPVFATVDQNLLRTALSGAAKTFRIYDGVGHNMQWEQPLRVAQDIYAFVP
jgi:pimeloyl-ACP methyl ester carboxylesterase